jgi:hypothetical protein
LPRCPPEQAKLVYRTESLPAVGARAQVHGQNKKYAHNLLAHFQVDRLYKQIIL